MDIRRAITYYNLISVFTSLIIIVISYTNNNDIFSLDFRFAFFSKLLIEWFMFRSLKEKLSRMEYSYKFLRYYLDVFMILVTCVLVILINHNLILFGFDYLSNDASFKAIIIILSFLFYDYRRWILFINDRTLNLIGLGFSDAKVKSVSYKAIGNKSEFEISININKKYMS